MKTVKGRYNEAVVYTDVVEEAALEQIRRLCDMEFTAGSRIRIMPDVHAGAGCTIGTTMTIRDKVVPNLVGVDIGCGMETVRIREKELDWSRLDALIRERIPAGFLIREEPHPYCSGIDLTELKCLRAGAINLERAVRSLGTLGGGNHFIEADRDERGNLYLVIHSGSRHLGLETAGYYQDQAFKSLNTVSKESVRKLIEKLKAEGRQREIEREVKAFNGAAGTGIPRELAYVSGAVMEDYIHDMKLVQRYAMLNRKAMMDELVRGMGLTVEEEFTTVHNYIDTEAMILRKGAVSAKRGEKLLIPINMKDGSLICIGKGNEEWNCSAPHGAGRLMSRRAAKKRFSVQEFEAQMKGIYTTSVGDETLDECPMAYKAMEDIVNNIGETAAISRVIRPVYNFKAGEQAI